ncbi:MAG TPA: tRNA pseudouridine(55) synthase TruB [Anaerovoracaceae bacterium]|nr:tRNA pseudouridine(55) synthase TruB [Anaerovoracaceae bacterium]
MCQHGIINLLKPAGMTSHDCVYQLRKITGIKRIGHTGTLDPMAAGVLPLCIGNATRIIDYLDLDQKIYRCEMILGITTDTYDIWGSVINDKSDDVREFSLNDIHQAFSPLKGRIFQTPPEYSAVRVEGRRLYEYAREGQKVKANKRPIVIYDLKVQSYNKETGRIIFDLACSKGTYVRTICHQVGEKLGCGGAMSFLLRTGSGAFNVNESVPFEYLKGKWKDYLLPMDYPLNNLGSLKIRENRASWFENGGYLKANEAEVVKRPILNVAFGYINHRKELDMLYSVYSDDRFLGVAVYDKSGNIYKADKVLCK